MPRSRVISQRRGPRAISAGTATATAIAKPAVVTRIVNRSAAGKMSRNATSPTRLRIARSRKSSRRSRTRLNSPAESGVPRSRRYHARTKSPVWPGVAPPTNWPIMNSVHASRSVGVAGPMSFEQHAPAPSFRQHEAGVQREREHERHPAHVAQIRRDAMQVRREKEVREDRGAEEPRQPARPTTHSRAGPTVSQLSGDRKRRLATCSEMSPKKNKTSPPRKNMTVEGGRCSRRPLAATDHRTPRARAARGG